MSTHPFKHCALGYLNQWYRTDRQFMNDLTAECDLDNLGASFHKLASKYMVARNFSTKEFKGDKRQIEIDRCWIKVAKAVCSTEIDRRASASDEVHALADALGKIFLNAERKDKADPTLLSAASKFLWFRGHHTIRIYDKRAVTALNQLQHVRAKATGKRKWKVDGDYQLFSDAWNQEFAACQPSLNVAIGALKEQLDWSTIPDGRERGKAARVIGKPWFRDRVFDKYLWHIGEAKIGGAGSFV